MLQELSTVLSPAEQQRAASFRFDHLTRGYTIGRGLLRLALGAYLGLRPESVQILRAPNGKPYLPGTRLRFNLSDSHDTVMFGFALDCELGVDIERVRSLPDLMNIAQSYFTEAECRTLVATAEADRIRAFYKLWTAKEAYLKFTGRGLATPRDEVNVHGLDSRLSAEEGSVRGPDVNSWFAEDVSPFEDYAACVALDSAISSVACRQFADAMEVAEFCRSTVRCTIPVSWHC